MARQIRGEEALVAGNKGAGGNGARAAPGGLARGFLFLLLLQNRNSFLREEISLEDASAGRRTVSPRAFDQRAIEFAAASLLGIGAQRNLCNWPSAQTTMQMAADPDHRPVHIHMGHLGEPTGRDQAHRIASTVYGMEHGRRDEAPDLVPPPPGPDLAAPDSRGKRPGRPRAPCNGVAETRQKTSPPPTRTEGRVD